MRKILKRWEENLYVTHSTCYSSFSDLSENFISSGINKLLAIEFIDIQLNFPHTNSLFETRILWERVNTFYLDFLFLFKLLFIEGWSCWMLAGTLFQDYFLSFSPSLNWENQATPKKKNRYKKFKDEQNCIPNTTTTRSSFNFLLCIVTRHQTANCNKLPFWILLLIFFSTLIFIGSIWHARKIVLLDGAFFLFFEGIFREIWGRVGNLILLELFWEYRLNFRILQDFPWFSKKFEDFPRFY